ncbi:FAD dependent oxidoreductase [Talaromyces proteolyticus]|uniref:FAD dependent oxidoreductase n=1 Tax=Talaromyces proteolyticus TaxID=1131652 RepID=A0AAD4PYM3_9EURO|nr:FAD dependent oxidoreductase [Talaromyces proteolyticus]KAH8701675.1 FAD dependent oxidoreductase [Talaromyces proteolyticus]
MDMSQPDPTARFCQALATKASQDPGLPVPNPTPAYWQSEPHELANHQSATLPNKADIAIIGSGITGISTAYHLLQQQPDLRITILEARALTSGATGRNGGHCKEAPYVDYSELKDLYGKEAATKVVKFRLAQLDALLEIATKLDSKEAIVRRVEGLDVYYDQDVFNAMKEKLADYLESFPDERETWLCFEGNDLNKKFGTVNAVGCMTGPAGALWPYKLVGSVAAHISNSQQYPNLTIETHTPVESIHTTEGEPDYPLTLKTPRGIIQTKHIVHCTNGHAGHLLPGLRGKLFPLRGQMTRQVAPSSFPRIGNQRSWILHYAPGYDYVTQSPSASGDIYIGGGLLKALLSGKITVEDADVGSTRDDLQSEEALKAIETAIEERLESGKGTHILDKWTGIMGFTIDDSPIVGKVPYGISGRASSSGAEWVAAGFCGHGMAYCWLTGKAVADMILKGEETVKEWFPAEQYICSNERLQKFTLVERLLSFSKIVA